MADVATSPFTHRLDGCVRAFLAWGFHDECAGGAVIGAIMPAIVHDLLCAEKEGVGIDDIAKVFD